MVVVAVTPHGVVVVVTVSPHGVVVTISATFAPVIVAVVTRDPGGTKVIVVVIVSIVHSTITC